MRAASRESQSPYEVRCARCDVSFPVETKVCIHCGGRTGPPGPMPSMEAFAAPPASTGGFDSSPASLGHTPSDSVASAYDAELEYDEVRGPVGVGDFGSESAGDGGAWSRDDEPAEQTQSPVRAILSSLGGMVWVLLFVAISIARSCGE